MCLRNGFWCWLSNSYPAAKYPDIVITRHEIKKVRETIKSNEFILVDKAWASNDMKSSNIFIYGHKKPKGQELSDDQLKENEVVGYFRDKIQIANDSNIRKGSIECQFGSSSKSLIYFQSLGTVILSILISI